MSSPIHHANDTDAELVYAPPWARSERAPPLPAQPLATAIDWPRSQRLSKSIRTFSGDRAIENLQRQLALNPDKLPEPPAEGEESLWPLALRTAAVGVVAALAAWAVVVVPGAKGAHERSDGPRVQALATDNPGPKDSVRVATAAWAAKLPTREAATPANETAQMAELTPVTPPLPAVVAAPQPASVAEPQPEAVAPPQPASASVSAPEPTAQQPSSDTVTLDNDELAMLVKRGKAYLENGDLSSARLLLRRAAEAGSASAALALGATYDPLVIERLGAIGAKADPTQARKWYKRAADLGSDLASRQLANLHD